ncbi:MAG: glycosyltransferase family 4 protein [bacterium]
MKIAHIHWSYKPIIGGVETHLEHLMQKSSATQKVFSGTNANSDYNIYVPSLDLSKKCNEELIQVKNFDVVNIHNGHLLKPALIKNAYPYLQKNNGQLILSVHNYSHYKESLDVLHLPFDKYIVFSKFMQNILKKEKINSEVLPLSFNIPNQENNEVNNDIPVIIQPTRFSNWKGSYDSLEAMNQLFQEKFPIKFIHAGAKNLLFDNVEINWNAYHSSIKNYITLDSFTEKGLLEQMKQSNIVIHPTKGTSIEGEPFGISCIQAMFLNKPLIVTNSGNLPDLVSEYKNKLVTEPNNPYQLKEAIKEFSKYTPDENTELLQELNEKHLKSAQLHEIVYAR